MTYFTNWFEIEVMYTDYCYECYDNGIEPKSREEWYKDFQNED